MIRQRIESMDDLPVPRAGSAAVGALHDPHDGHQLIGGARLVPLAPGNEDMEIDWSLHPNAVATVTPSEATHALANQAFSETEPFRVTCFAVCDHVMRSWSVWRMTSAA